MYANYEEIEIDRNDIQQELLNIDNKTRSNIYTWNGQFSPQFVEAILNRYGSKTDTVFDPFMGSGTTLVECARKGIQASGIEINPSAYFMSKSFELCNMKKENRKQIIDEIQVLVDSITDNDEIISGITHNIDSEKKDVKKNILSLLIILMDIFKNEVSVILLHSKWELLKNTIYNLPYSDKAVMALNGDTRQTPFSDDTFTMILTSPPYINVFNYHQKYRRSVEALGYNVLDIAKREFGSNRKHRGNRLYTVIQYCVDMALAMREWVRISNVNARFILVVGRESNVLSMNFSNSKLVYEIAVKVLKIEFLLKQERVFKNRYGQLIYEDILHFRNNKYSLDIDESDVIAKAKEIALSALEQKKSIINKDFKNYIFIEDAINKIDKVQKSEEIRNG